MSQVSAPADCEFLPCEPSDVHASVPLILESGPDQYRYVFSFSHKEQAEEFLRVAFLKEKGQWSYRNHTKVVCGGEQVGICGFTTHRQKSEFFWSAVFLILSFYGFFRGLLVAWRGIQAERVLNPPRAGVGFIYDVTVSEKVRGSGIGRALLAYLLEKVSSLSLERAGLDVSSKNPRAEILYKRMGFRTEAVNVGNLENAYGRIVTHHYLEAPPG